MINRTHTGLAIAILAVLFATTLTPAIQPLQDLRFAFVWPIGLGGIVAIGISVSIWKAHPDDIWIKRGFAFLLLGLGLGGSAWVAGLCASLLLNVVLDHSVPRQRVMRIESKEIRGQKRPSYWLIARDVSDTERGELLVEQSLFDKKFIGERVRVTTRAGGLGVERVERVK